jgi:cellobiose phosphorylase
LCYGRFSEDGLEYIIDRYDTPRPWINCITNGKYCALVSHTGGGYSFLGSSGYSRITRAYPPETVLSDRPGRYVYIRDRVTGEYWSVTWQPVQRLPSYWQARHGLGYTRIVSETRGIMGDILYFVPLGANLEVWRVKIGNSTGIPRELTIFPYVEWCLGNYAFDLIETGFSGLFNQVELREGMIVARKNLWNIGHRPQKPHAPWDKIAFMGTSAVQEGFDTVRESFTGMYRSTQNPVGVERGLLANSVSTGRDSCGAFQLPVFLDPGEEWEFTVTVGAAGSIEEAKSLVTRFSQLEAVAEESERLAAHWREYMGRLRVDTPDDSLDLAINVWNKYQSRFTFDWARMSSYYVGGGSIIGFRDTCQDVLGVVPMEPGRVKTRLRDIAAHQFRDGGTLHNWDPISGSGPRTGHSDDPLWLVLAVAAYVRETGEMGFLDESCAYYDEGEGIIYQHIQRAVEYTLGRLSSRGIPLMGAADWNDGLDQVGSAGRGESVFTAGLLALALRELEALAKERGDDLARDSCRGSYNELARAVNEHFWDGKWYVRAVTDDGYTIGSFKNDEGRVFLNAQAWPVLSGIAPRDRAIAAMDSVRELLDTPYGPALFLPAYSGPDPRIGIITMFSPGSKENGAVFNHSVAWAVMAEAILGRGDVAYEYYRKSLFLTQSRDILRYKAEPYVYAEYVHGPESPYSGMGEFSWTTGTAPWMFKVCTEWILGVRPEYGGLMVDPCIPPEWKGYRFQREFRGATYDIRVENPDRVSWGVRQVKIDGKPHEGQVLPDLKDAKRHQVDVVMGRAQGPAKG